MSDPATLDSINDALFAALGTLGPAPGSALFKVVGFIAEEPTLENLQASGNADLAASILEAVSAGRGAGGADLITAAVNAAVGGAANSAHLTGLACDFSCPSFGTPLAICQKLKPHMESLGIDQLIHEFGSWVHLGLSDHEPRMMALTIDNGGTRHGFA
jgi:hypothetical protein